MSVAVALCPRFAEALAEHALGLMTVVVLVVLAENDSVAHVRQAS